MGLWDKVYEAKGQAVPEHFKPENVQKLREKEQAKIQKMTPEQHKRHMAKKMKASGNDRYMDSMRQSRTNHAIRGIRGR